MIMDNDSRTDIEINVPFEGLKALSSSLSKRSLGEAFCFEGGMNDIYRDANGRLMKGHPGLNRNRGAEHHEWKGVDASYSAKHMWIAKHYGKASCCENQSCPIENPKRYEWSNISGEHKREREDYIQLCASCHRQRDKKRREKQ